MMNFCEGCEHYIVIYGLEVVDDRRRCSFSLFPGGIKCLNNRKIIAVDKPTHYTSGAVECIDAIRSALSPDEFRGFCKGNILKYVWRERLKNGDEDLKKGAQYMEWLIAEIEKKDK